MGVVLIVIAIIMIIAFISGGAGAVANPFSMVVAIVALALFSGVIREIIKNKKEHNRFDKTELAEIKQCMAKIESDIADIKEQIADFLIKQI
ncbi:hypothetical protein FJZ33_06885 [Candidatus Poribacteria bacterium]|nr:hypothetical protein [Candidatus Poribacteria bacterium]